MNVSGNSENVDVDFVWAGMLSIPHFIVGPLLGFLTLAKIPTGRKPLLWAILILACLARLLSISSHFVGLSSFPYLVVVICFWIFRV